MLDRFSPVSNQESKYLDPRHIAIHEDSLEGVPVGSTIIAQVQTDIRSFFRSMKQPTVKVKIVKPDGQTIETALPKRVFIGLPRERRFIDMRLQKPPVENGCFEMEDRLSESRANTINLAVHMATHNTLELDDTDDDDKKTVVPNPFRSTDTREVGETLAIVADHRNSSLHLGNRWQSHLQDPDDIKSVFKPGELSQDDEGGLRIDKNKLASVDHAAYRQEIKDAVDQLFANSRLSGEEDFPIS